MTQMIRIYNSGVFIPPFLNTCAVTRKKKYLVQLFFFVYLVQSYFFLFSDSIHFAVTRKKIIFSLYCNFILNRWKTKSFCKNHD